jgi:hypothetical protein
LFDGLPPGKKRAGLYRFFAVTYFLYGARERLPPCVEYAARDTFPNPFGTPYTGYSDTGDSDDYALHLVTAPPPGIYDAVPEFDDSEPSTDDDADDDVDAAKYNVEAADFYAEELAGMDRPDELDAELVQSTPIERVPVHGFDGQELIRLVNEHRENTNFRY